MKTNELRRLLQETGEAAKELVSAFYNMADNTDQKRERHLLEKLKVALSNYKVKQALCEKNGLKVKIAVARDAITIKMINPPLEIQLTEKDLKILQRMKISIEGF